MVQDEHVEQTAYDPNRLLDALLEKMRLKNDAALARMLDVQPPLISKIRHSRQPVSAGLLLRIHESTGMSIRLIRDLMGDRRTRFRLTDSTRGARPPVATGGGQFGSAP